MGTWGTGPFDNDSAADWAGDLDDADPGARPGLIREALEAAVAARDYLDADDGMIAVAASAVVAGAAPGGPSLDSSYGPDAATVAGLNVEADLRSLAAQALARVFEEDSEWRELWEEAGELEAARRALAPIVTALARPSGPPEAS